MKNIDIKNQEKKDLKEKALKALKEENVEEQAEVVQEWFDAIAKDAAEEVVKNNINTSNDISILNARGVKQLTSQEREYYNKLIDAMKSSNPKAALENVDVTMPVTTINRVFEDLTIEHPLLSLITVNNVTGMTETIIRTGDIEPAWWGSLSDEIKKEIEAGFKKETVSLCKLSAFLPISKAYLELGADWLDTFIRKVLAEALSAGLVKGIVAGTGVNQPVGMNADLEEAFTPGEARPLKEAIEVLDLEPTTVGPIIAKLTNGGKRVVTKVALIMNPEDYWSKVFPATTSKNNAGIYIKDQFPFPADFCQEPSVEKGTCLIGLPKKYNLNVGMPQKIEADDSFRFLDDERTYLAKMSANGSPVDNSSFIVLDISKLKPLTSTENNNTNTADTGSNGD